MASNMDREMILADFQVNFKFHHCRILTMIASLVFVPPFLLVSLLSVCLWEALSSGIENPALKKQWIKKNKY